MTGRRCSSTRRKPLKWAHSPRPVYYLRAAWDQTDTLSLRGYLARAYSAIGDTTKAFELYRPAFDETPCFETYAQARQLADAVSTERGAAFTTGATDHLRQQRERQRYLLCQVYLSENRLMTLTR